MTSVPDQWSEQARYDLATAADMMRARRFRYVLFCCQQAVEKMLKAIYARKLAEAPPRTHQLLPIAAEAKLILSEEQKDLLRELSAYYVQSRYPDAMEDREQDVPENVAADILRRTEGFAQWLQSTVP